MVTTVKAGPLSAILTLLVAITLPAAEGPSQKSSREGGIVWRIGTFFDGSREFAQLKSLRHVCDVPADGAQTNSFALPAVLAHDPAIGCRRLVVNFELKPGIYALARSFVRPQAPEEIVWCQTFFDDRELDVFYVGPEGKDWAGRPLPGPLGQPPADFDLAYYPFVCATAGRHQIALEMGHRPNEGRAVALDALALVPWQPRIIPHSLLEDIPGRVWLDGWGWFASVNFQRDRMVDFDYFRDKLIDESFKQGANFIQLHPHIGARVFEQKKIDPYALLEYIHARDMFVDEHVFPPREVREDAKGVLQWLATQWAPTSADAWTRGWRRAVDGFEGEAFNAMFERQNGDFQSNELLWPLNPVIYLNHAGYPEEPRWYGKSQSRAPNYIKSYVNAHFVGPLKIEAEGGKTPPIHGFDDHDPIPKYFHCGGLHRTWGTMFFGYQADCRVIGVKASSGSPRKFGGGSFPEWMVQQIDDFCRPRALEPKDPHASVFWWLGEPRGTLPAEYRQYVYVASQDPIKRAVVASLCRDGRGGWLEQRQQEIRREAAAEGYTPQQIEAADWHLLRPRYDLPADTWYIQNNYLRLCLSPRADGGLLLCDLQRSAHYDSNSLSIPLSVRALSTRIDNHEPTWQQQFEAALPGGHFARLRARACASSGPLQSAETRTYEMANDAPFLIATIERPTLAGRHQVSTVLGIEGYDRLVYCDQPVAGAAKFRAPGLPRVLLLESTGTPKPPLAVFLLDAGTAEVLEVSPGKEIAVTGPADQPESQRIAWGLPGGLYDSRRLEEVARGLQHFVREISFDPRGMTIENPLDAAWLQVLRICGAGSAPYLVEENGWWVVRGAQHGLGQEEDWLKVYLGPRAAARVIPYGLIDGVVKPAWGSQYQLAIGGPQADAAGARCEVRVLSVTPFLFAPRVQFARGIKRATLDGRPWHYFDGDVVFLPNQLGRHALTVEYGEQVLPSITRTYAAIKTFDVSPQQIRFEAAAPPWHGPMPEGRQFFAFVSLGEHALESIEPGSVVKAAPGRACIAFPPGVVTLRLKSIPAQAAEDGARYLAIVQKFADTLLEKGRDRFGPKQTALWASVIDVESYEVPRSADQVPTVPGVRESDRAVGGCNLYLDTPTLHVFRVLSALLGEPKYEQAVQQYLRDYLTNCQSPETGLLAWGEHLYYDLYEDRVVAERKSHELLGSTPPWDLLWQVDPAATARAIAGLRYHFRAADPAAEEWLFNRHANWATPGYTPKDGQPWIKHSALYAHAFSFLHAKTGDPRWQRYAEGSGDLYWNHRNPQTNLTESCIGDRRRTSRHASMGGTALLSYFLLKAYDADPTNRAAREHALAMLKAFNQYAWDAEKRRYREHLTVDGAPVPGPEEASPFTFAYGGGSTVLLLGRAAAYAARTQQDDQCREMAARAAAIVNASPIPEALIPESAGYAVHLYLDLYDLTKDPSYLHQARKTADVAVERLWAGGLFRRLAGDKYYESKLGPGELASALLRLAIRLERKQQDPGVYDWSF
jgi:hypothetical protein